MHMKRTIDGKIILTDKELRIIIQDALLSYISDNTSNGNSGRIEGNIPDVSDLISKMNYANDAFVQDNITKTNKVMIITEEIKKTLPIITEEEIKENGCTFEELVDEVIKRVDETIKRDFDEDGNPINPIKSKTTYSKNSFIDFDINNIPFEQLRKQYLNYSYELPFSSSDTSYKMVTETVNKSTSLNELRLLVIERFYLEDWQFLIREAHNNIDVALIVPNIPDSKDMIIQFIENEGYFRVGEREIKCEEMNWLQIQFEPYYQLPITQEILNDDIVNWKQWIWIEASGKVEEMCKTLGAFNVPSDYAIIYLQNVPYEECDEYHYSRMIAGKKEIKTIFGFKDAETFETITNDLNNKVEEFLKKTQNKKGGLNENLLKKEEIYQRYIQKKGDCQRYKDIIDYFIYLHEDEGINELPIESLNILRSAVDSLQEIIDTSNELIINRKYLKIAIEEGNELLTKISALYPIAVLVLTPI